MNYKYKVVLLLVALSVNLGAFSQSLSLYLHSVMVSKAMTELKQKTGYSFVFEGADLNTKKKVTVNAQSLDEAIKQILQGQNATYEIQGKSIIVRHQVSASAPVSRKEELQQQKTTIRATGKVVDEKGEPIIGATVKERETNNGTITDLNGRYSLDVPESSTLEISYIGYQNDLVRAGVNKNVVLTQENETLNEVVVVGYGSMKKRDLTGAISSVKGEDLALIGVASVAHALEGKMAGLYIRQNSAQPGGGLDILIRGAGSVNSSNEPLYIVDGFPIAKLDQTKGNNQRMDPGTQSVLNFLNPNDIESIEVLKDASATAIYGARAANGVVIITTKRGKEGKARVNYSYNYSYQKYADNYDVLSLKEWMDEKNKSTWEQWIWENKVAPWGSRSLEEAISAPVNGLAYSRPYTDEQIANAGEGTDWVGLITRNGDVQEHNISIQGGSNETQYMVSFNYYDNEGIIKNSGMTRYALKSNFDQKFLDIFKTGVNLTLTRIDNNNTQLGSAQYEKSGIIRSAVQMGPNIKAYDPATGTYPINPLLGTQPNPYSLLNNIDKGRVDRLLGNIYLEAYPIKGLTLRLNAGIDKAEMTRKTYEPKTTLWGKAQQGNADIYNTDNNQYLLEATATYNRTFNDIHKVTLLAGTSYEEFNYETSNLGNNNFLTDGFIYNNMGAGTGTKDVGSGFSKNKMESYFFRANYILKDRYMFTTTLRADGASVFAKNHKWGYFPSAALAWTISEENFMKKASST
jgi:TonB-linked SusC/RagA family outer membrane protein